MTKQELLSALDFLEKIIEKSGNNVSSNIHLNLSIFYGLFFGLIGNLTITSFFEYQHEQTRLLFWVLMGSLLLILFFTGVVWKENKKFKRLDSEIQAVLTEIIKDRDAIESEKYSPSRQELSNKYLAMISRMR